MILSIDNLEVQDTRRVAAVKNFSLDVRAGEIVGLAGIDGNHNLRYTRKKESPKWKIRLGLLWHV